jgi:GDP-D-mannose 3',5'-epimerase
MDFWRRRKVLVTGGAGFIGSRLVRRLVSLSARVTVVDNLVRGSSENLGGVLDAVQFLQRDLTNQESCLKACADMEVVFHLAARVGGINYYLGQPGEVITQNVLMDALMLQAALACGVERYAYASSAHVYPLELQLTPDAPLIAEGQALPAHPELSYGWAKLLGEKQIEYVVAEGAPIRAAILRLIGVYGENQDADLATGSAIPVFVRRAIEYPARTPFVILGTGEETRSYCYVEDVIDAMLLAVEKLDQSQLLGPMNIGSEDRIKINDLAEEIIARSGKDIEPVHDISHETVVWGQALDCSKARQTLDSWQTRTSLQDGLERVYSHMLRKLSGNK